MYALTIVTIACLAASTVGSEIGGALLGSSLGVAAIRPIEYGVNHGVGVIGAYGYGAHNLGVLNPTSYAAVTGPVSQSAVVGPVSHASVVGPVSKTSVNGPVSHATIVGPRTETTVISSPAVKPAIGYGIGQRIITAPVVGHGIGYGLEQVAVGHGYSYGHNSVGAIGQHGITVQGPPTVPVVIAGPSGKIVAHGLWGPTSQLAHGGYAVQKW